MNTVPTTDHRPPPPPITVAGRGADIWPSPEHVFEDATEFFALSMAGGAR